MSKFYVPISIYGTFDEIVEANTAEEAEQIVRDKLSHLLQSLYHGNLTTNQDKNLLMDIRNNFVITDTLVSEAEKINEGE